MNKRNHKKKVSIQGILGTIILSLIISFSISDLANLVNADPIHWDNKTLFIAQITTIIMFISIHALAKIKLYKEEKTQ